MQTPLVDTDWLAAHLGAADLRIFDCSMVRQDNADGSYAFVNGHAAWQAGHIAGSVHVDVGSALSDRTAAFPLTMPPIDELAARFGALGIGDDSRVVLYDSANHGWAARVWWLLRVCGFDNAAVLNGGWKKWCVEQRTISTAATVYAPATLTARPRPALMVGKDEVLAALGRNDTRLILALSPAVWSGKLQLFRRAGRIPGSVNVHCDALLDPVTNTYLPTAQLRQLFAAAGTLDGSKAITYCGGGIAACSDALALALLGVSDVAVYDGSLSEWTADPALPMECS